MHQNVLNILHSQIRYHFSIYLSCNLNSKIKLPTYKCYILPTLSFPFRASLVYSNWNLFPIFFSLCYTFREVPRTSQSLSYKSWY